MQFPPSTGPPIVRWRHAAAPHPGERQARPPPDELPRRLSEARRNDAGRRLRVYVASRPVPRAPTAVRDRCGRRQVHSHERAQEQEQKQKEKEKDAILDSVVDETKELAKTYRYDLPLDAKLEKRRAFKRLETYIADFTEMMWNENINLA